MTPALYKTPSLLWLITVPIMMVMRMVRIKLDLIGKYVPCICLDSHDDLSLEWIGCIHRWPHLSHRGKSEKIIANHCWSHRITANLPNLVTYPLALEQTNGFVMHGLITADEASKMNCVDITMALSKDGLKSKRHVLWQLLILPRPVWLHLVSDVLSL